MEVVLRCENYVQVDALTVVDFTILYVVCLLLIYKKIVNKLTTNGETRDDNNNRA